MAGRGSLAGLLAYGNANEIVVDMAREVLPVVKHTPVLAGVNGTDPFCMLDAVPGRAEANRLPGVQNFPTVGLIDGVFRPESRRDRHGLRPRGRHDRALRTSLDMLTTPYVFDEGERHRDDRGRRRHHRLPHGPDHRRQHRRRDGAARSTTASS